jgi:hypothetical protein
MGCNSAAFIHLSLGIPESQSFLKSSITFSHERYFLYYFALAGAGFVQEILHISVAQALGSPELLMIETCPLIAFVGIGAPTSRKV